MSRNSFGKKIWDRQSDLNHHLNDLRIDTNSSSNSTSDPTRPNLNRNRSSSPMLSAFGLQQPWIKIQLAEELLYLHPAIEGTPTEDPWVSGTITLWLPKARVVKHLTVRLIGRADIGWPDAPYESSLSLDKKVSLVEDDAETLLEKGQHTFSFSIIVPSSTAPYERCPFGRARHFVVAKAKGLGSMGSDIVSEEKPIFLIVNPGGAGASCPPPSLHYKIEGLTNDLGPYTIALQSQHIMVAGLLLLRFSLISPPTSLTIMSLKVKINQHYSLRSNLDRTRTANPPVDPRTVMLLNASHPPNFGVMDVISSSKDQRSRSSTPSVGPLKGLAIGQEWKVHHLARIPNDNSLRPSTQIGTDAGISIRHDIVVELLYQLNNEGMEVSEGKSSKGKEKEKKIIRKMVITKPLDLFSCCCFLDSLTLPLYSIIDPHPSVDAYAPPCVCGMQLKDVISLHADTLLREEGEQGVTYAPILKDEEQRSGSSTPTTQYPPHRGRPGRDAFGTWLRQDSDDSSMRSPGSG